MAEAQNDPHPSSRLILPLPATDAFGLRLAEEGRWDLGTIETRRFPDASPTSVFSPMLQARRSIWSAHSHGPMTASCALSRVHAAGPPFSGRGGDVEELRAARLVELRPAGHHRSASAPIFDSFGAFTRSRRIRCMRRRCWRTGLPRKSTIPSLSVPTKRASNGYRPSPHALAPTCGAAQIRHGDRNVDAGGRRRRIEERVQIVEQGGATWLPDHLKLQRF